MQEQKATAEELAYLAGIMDGEGSVSIVANQGISHALNVSVANTSLVPLELLQRLFGGAIYAHKKRTAKIGGGLRKQMYQWHAQNGRGAVTLAALLPHMRIKLAQAQLALEFNASRLASVTSADQRRFGRRGPEVWDRHEDFRRRLMELNGARDYRRVEMREPKKYISPRTPSERLAYIKAWRAENREKVRATNRRSKQKHSKETLAATREWKRKNKALTKANWQAYYQEHRDELLQKARDRRAAKKAAPQPPEETIH